MAQTITIRIDNSPEERGGGGPAGTASGGGLPTPAFSGVSSGADLSAMAVPTPFEAGSQAAQADMAAPQPSRDFLPAGHAVSEALPTPFSGGAAGVGSVSAGAMGVPTPMDSMVTGAPANQVPTPAAEVQPDLKGSGGSPSEEGSGRKLKK